MHARKAIQVLTVFFLLSVLAGCSQGEPEAAWKMISEGALLVDVRTPEEFNQGHLPNAVLIPVADVAKRIAEFGEDKDRPIVVYCKAGVRAGKAERVLKENGYTNVLNGGGYSDLMAAKP